MMQELIVKYRLDRYLSKIARKTYRRQNDDFYFEKPFAPYPRADKSNHYDSWGEAHAALVKRSEERIAHLKKQVAALEKKLPKIKAMEPKP